MRRMVLIFPYSCEQSLLRLSNTVALSGPRYVSPGTRKGHWSERGTQYC